MHEQPVEVGSVHSMQSMRHRYTVVLDHQIRFRRISIADPFVRPLNSHTRVLNCGLQTHISGAALHLGAIELVRPLLLCAPLTECKALCIHVAGFFLLLNSYAVSVSVSF